MPFIPGTKLGPYEIVAPLGAGGMGEVYRAKDTRLAREVALKFLPGDFAEDPERHARFEREAKLLASLNHPHIAVLYGLERIDGQVVLAMELVDGAGLDELIARGPIATEEAIGIATQIAEGMEAAHEKGIVHRDLKPANIKVRADGAVKVLDFGLAKAWEEPAAPGDVADSPTLTGHYTRAGVILGTAAYMSPEQARGRPVDKRADIWAFGVVLFEMLTATRLFGGETVSDVLAGVLTREPDWAALPAATPPSVIRLLRRCLERDPKLRLRDIGEARIELSRTPHEEAPSAGPALARRGSRLRELAAWSAVLLLSVAAVALWRQSAAAPERPPVLLRASIVAPEGLTFVNGVLDPYGPAVLSPDGRLVVFPASARPGHIQLWARALDAAEPRPLAGTEQGSYPFWSPDSRSIGFFAGGKLRTLEVAGGAPFTLCDAPSGRGGTWGPDGTIVFAPSLYSTLLAIAATGGTTRQVTQFDAAKRQSSHRWPFFLPDGRHFLYYSFETGFFDMVAEQPWDGVYMGSLDGSPGRFLVRSSSEGQYASSHLLYLREDSLVAAPFDLSRLSLAGEPKLLAEGVDRDLGRSKGSFTVSAQGTLAFQEGRESNQTQLTWLDRAGRRLGTLGEPGILGEPSISPDGKSAAVSRFDTASRTTQVWRYDLAMGVGSRFTLGTFQNRFPVWSADGSRIFFAQKREDGIDLRAKAANGSGDEELIYHSGDQVYPMCASRDGRFVVLTLGRGDGIFALSLAGEKTPRMLTGKTRDPSASLSPDSRWLAYNSEESGRNEVYVASFPEPGGKWQVSQAGGTQPVWRRDGRELFFTTGDGELMAAEVKEGGASPELGTPKLLFQFPPIPNTNYWYYAAASDGQKFLATMPIQTQQPPISLVVGWPELLKK
jgi:eukaryotic-like serine/threonine-protein kinase